VVAQGRLFVTDRVGDQERLTALDASSGALIWQRPNHVEFEPHSVGRRHGNGPKATPLVSDGNVYSVGIAGWLQCRDARDGRERWHVNLPEAFGAQRPLSGERAYVNGTENVIVPIGAGRGAPVPLFGYTGSPTVANSLLITSVGGERGGTIMAFDRQSGRVAWKSLSENVAYSSPVVARIAGVTQVVVMTGPRVVGLDVQSGRLLWSHPFQIQYDESISTPVTSDEWVLVTGDGHPLTALRIEHRGEQFTCAVAWENYDLSSYLSSMVVHAAHVYGMNDDGEFHCARLSDGKTVWSGGEHGYYCTPVLAGEQILGLNDEGALLVLTASPAAFRQRARMQLSDAETWTTPAVVGNHIWVRSAEAVRCFEFSP